MSSVSLHFPFWKALCFAQSFCGSRSAGKRSALRHNVLGQRRRSAEMRNASEILRNAGGENVRGTFARTEADEPSRGRRIFQQKNICDGGKYFAKFASRAS